MKTKQEWELICAKIEKYLKYNSIKVIDFYLVGSKVDNENTTSDFDSLIIIENIACIEELKRLREILDIYIKTTRISEDFHYKIFNATELKLLATYDAFRLASFQKKHVSIMNSAIINNIVPVLDEKSFINSFLIQLVYNFLRQYPISDKHTIYENLRFWIQFHLETKEIIPKISADFQYFISQDLLVSNFWTYFHSETWEKKDLECLLNKYFLRLRHEYINKYATYMNIVLNVVK